MKLKIIRIENRIVACEIDDGTIIDIARRWFTDDIQEDDIIELNAKIKSKKMGSKLILPINLFLFLFPFRFKSCWLIVNCVTIYSFTC